MRIIFDIQNILADWVDRSNKFWGILLHFGTYLLKFCHCVSQVRDFELLCHFFCKTLRFSYIQDFLFGIELWFFAVENLWSSHHVSVVRGLSYVLELHARQNMSKSSGGKPRGQIISKANFNVFISTKNRTEIFFYFCTSSRKWVK